MLENKVNYPVLRVFLLDELATLLALLAALLVRHTSAVLRLKEIFGNLYIVIAITLCLFHIIVFLLYDNRKDSIFEQDPIENLMTVIKSKVILLSLTLIYLYVVQRSKQVSRTVVLLFLIFVILFDYVLRMLYRFYILKLSAYKCKQPTLRLLAPFPNDEELNELVKNNDFSDVLLLGGESDPTEYIRVQDFLYKNNIRYFCGLNSLGYLVKSGIITDVDGYAAIPVSVRNDRFDLFGVNYSIARVEEAVIHVLRQIDQLKGKYICFSNVHTSVMAREDEKYREVLNASAMIFPDGNPIAILQRKRGILGAERVAGPDFMEHMFRNTQDGSISHFFYGSTQETLDALKTNLESRYPGIVIKGMYSPPFRELSEEEDAADVAMINASGADIVWVGLGAPKQEKWMNAHKDKVNSLMMGVGAGFDFHAGTIDRAPVWIQKMGMEWLYRLFQDPNRLFKRYFVTNTKFFWYLLFNRLQ